jgi:hypothetical protein
MKKIKVSDMLNVTRQDYMGFGASLHPVDKRGIQGGFFVERQSSESEFAFLFCEKSVGIIGRAKVSVRSVQTFSPKLQKFFKKLVGGDDMWECSEVSFMIPDESEIHNDLDRFADLCDKFYKGLYEKLYAFACKHDATHMISTNVISEHDDISFFGSWPFRYEIESSNLFPHDQNPYVVGLIDVNSFSYNDFIRANRR